MTNDRALGGTQWGLFFPQKNCKGILSHMCSRKNTDGREGKVLKRRSAAEGPPFSAEVPRAQPRLGGRTMGADVRIWFFITMLMGRCGSAVGIDLLLPTKPYHQGQVDFLRAPGLLDLHRHPTRPEASMATPNQGEMSAPDRQLRAPFSELSTDRSRVRSQARRP